MMTHVLVAALFGAAPVACTDDFALDERPYVCASHDDCATDWVCDFSRCECRRTANLSIESSKPVHGKDCNAEQRWRMGDPDPVRPADTGPLGDGREP